jgi:hypothetical protein
MFGNIIQKPGAQVGTDMAAAQVSKPFALPLPGTADGVLAYCKG